MKPQMTSKKLNETLTDTLGETLNWHPRETQMKP